MNGTTTIKSGKQCTYVKVPTDIILDPRIDGTSLKLYCYLARYPRFNKNKTVIKDEKIEKDLGKHRTTIWRKMQILAKYDYIKVDSKKEMVNGEWITNRTISISEPYNGLYQWTDSRLKK